MSFLPFQFREVLTTTCAVSQGDSLVVAVSGGPDSMALLHLLAGVQQQLDLELVVVWVDHGLRPLETEAEGRVVQNAAKQFNLPFIASFVDVPSFAREQHLSVEHAARDLRYHVLRKVLHEKKADSIVVAHTADDQTEEILIRLLRGSGRKGISGMRARSGDIVRPLLFTEKQRILDWLAEQRIFYCQDSSNTDLKFTRNRVRHELLPFLEEKFDAGIRQSLRKSGDSLATDEALLEELTEEAFGRVVRKVEQAQEAESVMRLTRQPFISLHPALQRRIVEQLLWQLGARASYGHIMSVCRAAATGRNKSELHLSKGLRVGVFREYLEFSYPAGHTSWRGRLFA